MLNFQKKVCDLGIFFEYKKIKIAFGSKALTQEKLSSLYPNVHFFNINQKHTTLISNENALLPEADGHQWIQPNTSCLIRTADCLPLIAYDHNTSQITNLHCGRKGLVDGILDQFLKITNTNSNYSFFIGPHIQTYEIGLDMYNELKDDFSDHILLKDQKYYFSLSSLVKDFLVKHFKSYKIYECGIDTFVDDNYWSYRADNKTLLRNINFAFSVRQSSVTKPGVYRKK